MIHQIVHSGVSVCTLVPDQQRCRQRSAQRAIKYLSTNPSRHAIPVTIRNSRFARDVTAPPNTTRAHARGHRPYADIHISREFYRNSIFRLARWTINRLFARVLVYTRRSGNISWRCKQTLFFVGTRRHSQLTGR